MEKRRGNQAMGIAALFIAVIGLSLGFAAFSNTLTIRSSATVTPDATELNVDISSTAANPVTTSNVSVTSSTGVTTSEPTIDNSAASAPVISGLHATFTQPGQNAVYTFYGVNVGNLTAYLKSITFNEDSTGTKHVKSCTPASIENTSYTSQASSNLVSAACDDFTITVAVKSSDGANTIQSATAASVSSISTNNSIAKNAAQQIIVTLAYEDNTTKVPAGTNHYVDGPVDVVFPDIILTYSSAN